MAARLFAFKLAYLVHKGLGGTDSGGGDKVDHRTQLGFNLRKARLHLYGVLDIVGVFVLRKAVGNVDDTLHEGRIIREPAQVVQNTRLSLLFAYALDALVGAGIAALKRTITITPADLGGHMAPAYATIDQSRKQVRSLGIVSAASMLILVHLILHLPPNIHGYDDRHAARYADNPILRLRRVIIALAASGSGHGTVIHIGAIVLLVAPHVMKRSNRKLFPFPIKVTLLSEIILYAPPAHAVVIRFVSQKHRLSLSGFHHVAPILHPISVWRHAAHVPAFFSQLIADHAHALLIDFAFILRHRRQQVQHQTTGRR